MSSKQLTVNQCQFQNARGQRCNMLIDTNHRHGTGQATLCAFHAERLLAKVPLVDPEVLATELLGGIDGFASADAVNLFIGNVVRQLARKRIARRDAIAFAYLSQLLLNSLGALQKEAEVQEKAESKAEAVRFHNTLVATSRLFNEKRSREQSSGAPPSTEKPADANRDRPEPKPRPENPTYADLRT
jgi:primosomal protein N''